MSDSHQQRFCLEMWCTDMFACVPTFCKHHDSAASPETANADFYVQVLCQCVGDEECFPPTPEPTPPTPPVSLEDYCLIAICFPLTHHKPLLLSPFMKVIWNFRFNTSKNYNVNFDLDLRAASSVRISETKRDFGVGPKPQHSLCSRVSPTLSWKWPSVHARARFGSVYFLMASFGVF